MERNRKAAWRALILRRPGASRRRMPPRPPHFQYSSIVERPQFSWPGGKRLAFHISLNLEVFSFNHGLGISYSPGLPHPNSYNWAWREYGNRVGVWRLLKLFDEMEMPVSLL